MFTKTIIYVTWFVASCFGMAIGKSVVQTYHLPGVLVMVGLGITAYVPTRNVV